jgi:hypothetical protein
MRSTRTGHHSHPRRRTELTDSGPFPSSPYSPECVEEEFCELRPSRILRISRYQAQPQSPAPKVDKQFCGEQRL